MPRSTVSAILARIGLGKLSALERPEPPNRTSVASAPGGLLAYADVKKLAEDRSRWPRVHRQPQGPGRPAPDGNSGVRLHRRSATRELAYVEVLTDRAQCDHRCRLTSDERSPTSSATYGIRVERPDDRQRSSAYRSAVHGSLVERFGSGTCGHGPTGHGPTAKPSASIRTMLAAAGPTGQSTEAPRSASALSLAGPPSTIGSGHTAALGRQAPIERLLTLMNNVPGTYS